MLLGVHEDREPQFTRERFPRAKLFREFIPGVLKPQSLVDKVRRLGEPVWANGGVLVVSFKPDLKAVASGDWDTHLQGLAGWLRASAGPTFVVPWHEPENDMRGSQFVSMFNHVRRVMKDEYPTLTVIHSAMAYQYRLNGKAENTGEWVTEADLNTCDVYSGKSFPLDQILPEHPGFKRWFAEFGGKSWGITERGFHASAGSIDDCKKRAAVIRREAEWLARNPSCAMYIYWNTSGTEDNPDLVLDSRGEDVLEYLVELVGGGDPPPPPKPTTKITCPTCKGKGEIEVVTQ